MEQEPTEPQAWAPPDMPAAAVRHASDAPAETPSATTVATVEAPEGEVRSPGPVPAANPVGGSQLPDVGLLPAPVVALALAVAIIVFVFFVQLPGLRPQVLTEQIVPDEAGKGFAKPVDSASAELPGVAGEISAELRQEGFVCSDEQPASLPWYRICSREKNFKVADVRFTGAADGEVQALSLTADSDAMTREQATALAKKLSGKVAGTGEAEALLKGWTNWDGLKRTSSWGSVANSWDTFSIVKAGFDGEPKVGIAPVDEKTLSQKLTARGYTCENSSYSLNCKLATDVASIAVHSYTYDPWKDQLSSLQIFVSPTNFLDDNVQQQIRDALKEELALLAADTGGSLTAIPAWVEANRATRGHTAFVGQSVVAMSGDDSIQFKVFAPCWPTVEWCG